MTCRHYAFTIFAINTRVSPSQVIKWFPNTCRYITDAYWSVERGDRGTYHFQCHFDCYLPVRGVTIANQLGLPKGSYSFKPIKNGEGLDPLQIQLIKSRKYTRKESTHFAGPFTYHSINDAWSQCLENLKEKRKKPVAQTAFKPWCKAKSFPGLEYKGYRPNKKMKTI